MFEVAIKQGKSMADKKRNSSRPEQTDYSERPYTEADNEKAKNSTERSDRPDTTNRGGEPPPRDDD